MVYYTHINRGTIDSNRKHGRLWIISRVKDADVRKNLELDDRWCNKISFDDEAKAKQDFIWLTNHNSMREYLLVAEQPLRDTPYLDDLADDVPF